MRQIGWETRSPRRASLKRPWLAAYLGLIVFSLCGLLLTRMTGIEATWIASLAGAATIICGLAAVLAPVLAVLDRHLTMALTLIIFGVGVAAEVVGIYTGFPFGRYEYTGDWWPSIWLPGGHSFPILLPFAWMMMAGAAALTARRFLHGTAAVLGGGALAALADVFMEPVMTKNLGYWRWLESGPLPGGVPLMNAFGWILTSAICAGIMHRWLREEHIDDTAPAIVLIVHVIFTVLVGVIAVPA